MATTRITLSVSQELSYVLSKTGVNVSELMENAAWRDKVVRQAAAEFGIKQPERALRGNRSGR